ncbi:MULTISPECIES: hypothetical protein [Bacteroidaceae]|nr:hypothetical protein [Bacteroides gallinaceum]
MKVPCTPMSGLPGKLRTVAWLSGRNASPQTDARLSFRFIFT